jgi:FkbM family methyltransferase
MKFFKRLHRRIRKRLFPTEHEQTVRRWWKDGGDESLRLNYDLTPASLVFDLGGFEGNWAHAIHQRHGCRIHVFEPVPEFAAAIAARFQGNPNIQTFPYGLAAHTRTEQIALCSDGSSVFRQAASTQPIELLDVAAWFAGQDVPEIALMKINIEGGEYELLERLIETRLIARIRDIQVQFHELSPDSAARMRAIQAGLARTHRPTYQYRFVWENWRRA